MAASEDDLAKERVKEAVWQWAARIVVLAVAFGFGFFAAYVQWGWGLEGAPTLRKKTVDLEAQVTELKNQRVDITGRLTVTQGQLTKCLEDLSKARTAAAAAAATKPQ
jgi:hypothetical protein